MCPKWGFTAAARRWDLTGHTKRREFEDQDIQEIQNGMTSSRNDPIKYNKIMKKFHKHVAITLVDDIE